MNIVILGDGLLGKELHKQTGWDYVSRKKDNFDITQPSFFYDYFLENYHGSVVVNKYDVVINCVAYTETYSKNKQKHWDVNYKGVVDLANFCDKWGIKLVHISTDHVYCGSVYEASEEDIPIHGNTWYSYTKLLGDSYVQLFSNNLILRGTHKPTPFPYKKAWIDQVGNFDYVDKIASIIVELVKKNAKGIFNVGTEVKSMFELAVQTKKDIIPTLVIEKDIPRNTTMNLNKLKQYE